MSKPKWNPIKDIGKGLNKVNEQLERGKLLQDLGKNVERNVSTDLGNFGALFSGKKGSTNNQLTSFGRGALGVTSNRKDLKFETRMGEDTTTRMAREAGEAVEEAGVKDAQTALDAQGQMIADTIYGLREAKKRAPGRRQVMGNLLGTARNNNLLSSDR